MLSKYFAAHVGMSDALVRFRLGITKFKCHEKHYKNTTDISLQYPHCDREET